MVDNPKRPRIFEASPGSESRRVWLPWKDSLRMCWSSVRSRRGRFVLIFLGIAVVVAFLMSTVASGAIVDKIAASGDIHARAVLEKAGIFAADSDAAQSRADRKIWLMGLSCALCFFGIANTMLMSVTERVSEIGTLKCLGAIDRFVVRLILIESLFIGLLGSVVGTAFGYLLALLQTGLTLEFGLLNFETALPPLLWAAPASIAFGSLLTILAAIYPTVVAARMEPVEAMRSEV